MLFIFVPKTKKIDGKRFNYHKHFETHQGALIAAGILRKKLPSGSNVRVIKKYGFSFIFTYTPKTKK